MNAMGGAAARQDIGEGKTYSRDYHNDPLIKRQKHRGLPCPHCGGITQQRSSRLITPTFREIFCACLNEACSHTFKASLSYDYGLSPSGIPNPEIDLPMYPEERIAGVTIQATGPPAPDPNQTDLFE